MSQILTLHRGSPQSNRGQVTHSVIALNTRNADISPLCPPNRTVCQVQSQWKPNYEKSVISKALGEGNKYLRSSLHMEKSSWCLPRGFAYGRMLVVLEDALHTYQRRKVNTNKDGLPQSRVITIVERLWK